MATSFMKRAFPKLLVGLLFSDVWSAPAFAHGGGLNAEGCHNDRRNGGYHCHRSPSRQTTPVRAFSAPRRNLYANCSEVRAAGAAPLRLGDAGYGTHLDRDGDGIACEGSASASPVQIARPRVLPAPLGLVTKPAAIPASLLPPIEGTAQVLDGDTIQIGTIRIRLYGIDAFEAEQLCETSQGNTYGCGGRATRALADQVTGKTVSCTPKGIDAYGRQLAVCRETSVDLSSWMARNGHALAYTKYALDYVIDEKAAKAESIGAWGGTFQLPWEFRTTRPSGAAEAQRSATAPSANCTIKGNVNKNGERIYHLPSDPFYPRVKPENWFCSADEAEQAGFRRAGRP
jgi:endonuclease YncB( thermonuclease family)